MLYRGIRMSTIKNFFTYERGIVTNKELGKLISYGYDLHERDFQSCCGIPTFQFAHLGSFIPYGKKTVHGGIYGWRIYRDHSSSMLLTQIGVFEQRDTRFTSYFLETNNLNFDTFSVKTKLIENG